MREIIERVYTIEELSEEAREKAHNRYCESLELFDYYDEDFTKEELIELCPFIEPLTGKNKGISFDVYGGYLNYDAEIDHKKAMQAFIKQYPKYHMLKYVNWYTGGIAVTHNKYVSFYANLDDDRYNRPIPRIKAMINELEDFIRECYIDACKKMLKNISDTYYAVMEMDYFIERCKDNDYEFYEEGGMF